MNNKKEEIKEQEDLNEECNAAETEEVKTDEETPVEETQEERELSLEEKYEQALAERDAFKDKWMRRAAEFENYKRRSNKDKQDWIKNANRRIVLEICDVMDDFERALSAEAEKHQLKTFRKGVNMIFDKLVNLTKKEGVEKIEALGKEFDPNYHEALAHIPSDKKKDKIAAIIRNGYKMNEKVIRPAQVAVSNGEKPKKTKKDK